MSALRELQMLSYQLNEDEAKKLWKIVGGFWEYVVLVAKYNVMSEINENLDGRKEIEEKYNKCLDGLKEINKMSNRVFKRNIYKRSYTRYDVENFFLETFKEMQENKILFQRYTI